MAESIGPRTPHRTVDINTPQGLARAYIVEELRVRRGTFMLGHGAGRGTNTPDIELLTHLADDGWRVILIDQPWVVAGKRIAPAPAKLDEAWLAVCEALADECAGRLVIGGRSAGARAACRTARKLKADAVIALAFPLKPPKHQENPEKWRTAEAQSVIENRIPLLVIQGEKDPFGDAAALKKALPHAEVLSAHGPHSFSSNPTDVLEHARTWLANTFWSSN